MILVRGVNNVVGKTESICGKARTHQMQRVLSRGTVMILLAAFVIECFARARASFEFAHPNLIIRLCSTSYLPYWLSIWRSKSDIVPDLAGIAGFGAKGDPTFGAFTLG